MQKVFNTTGPCIPEKHYMVDISSRLAEIARLVADGKYFTITKARQYGKTTILKALYGFLQRDYYVVLMDFQTFSASIFQEEGMFVRAFAKAFRKSFLRNRQKYPVELENRLKRLETEICEPKESGTLMSLFELLGDICAAADRPVVLMVDEVDSAANNQVFLDFLSQLRAQYLDRDIQAAFLSVILAGVYDIRNLKQKLRPEDEHRYNSPWNIAADFNVEMSFSKEEIEKMLEEYEGDHATGMATSKVAEKLFDYTSGYPFLVSRLCQLMDEVTKNWTEAGFFEALRILLSEKNTLFESLSGKLSNYQELNSMLVNLLFTGKTVIYNYYEQAINIATIFGFVKNQNGTLMVSNRIFETWLYNLYLSTAQMQQTDIYKASVQDKSQFIVDGHLNMKHILERFVIHFHDIYGDVGEKFLEEEGRRYFLLYLRPIINGTGNYYIEAQTRNMSRTDIIVDYRGEQYIIECKIWRGQEYHKRGEHQLAEYLDQYHTDTGYLLSFNFNQKKEIGLQEIVIGNKRIIEAVV